MFSLLYYYLTMWASNQEEPRKHKIIKILDRKALIHKSKGLKAKAELTELLLPFDSEDFWMPEDDNTTPTTVTDCFILSWENKHRSSIKGKKEKNSGSGKSLGREKVVCGFDKWFSYLSGSPLSTPHFVVQELHLRPSSPVQGKLPHPEVAPLNITASAPCIGARSKMWWTEQWAMLGRKAFSSMWEKRAEQTHWLSPWSDESCSHCDVCRRADTLSRQVCMAITMQ